MNKGLAASLGQHLQTAGRQPRRHVPLFCLPSHLPRASALSLVLRQKGDSSLLSRFGADPNISDAARGEWEALRCLSRLQTVATQSAPAEETRRCARERSVLRFDKYAAARARSSTTLWFLMYIHHIRQASFETRRHGSPQWSIDSLSPLERGMAAGQSWESLAIQSAYLLRRQRSQAKKAPLTCLR